MGIKVEFNPDLALRNIEEYQGGNREIEECIPNKLERGATYKFLKEGQRNYWLGGEIPLLETKGDEELSRPLASIVLLESTHFMVKGIVLTRGKYRVVDVFDYEDNKHHFNGFARIN